MGEATTTKSKRRLHSVDNTFHTDDANQYVSVTQSAAVELATGCDRREDDVLHELRHQPNALRTDIISIHADDDRSVIPTDDIHGTTPATNQPCCCGVVRRC